MTPLWRERRLELALQRDAARWNRAHGVEWPYGYPDAAFFARPIGTSAREQQLLAWHDRRRTWSVSGGGS